MIIHNYMEDAVKHVLEGLLASKKEVCKCPKCKLDIVALALNQLPSKYVVTETGRMYTKLKEQEIQFRADIIRELTKAITTVSSKPRH